MPGLTAGSVSRKSSHCRDSKLVNRFSTVAAFALDLSIIQALSRRERVNVVSPNRKPISLTSGLNNDKIVLSRQSRTDRLNIHPRDPSTMATSSEPAARTYVSENDADAFPTTKEACSFPPW